MARKNNEKLYKKNGVTPEKLMAFIARKSGIPRAKVADNLHKGERTISRWTGEIEDFIKSTKEYQEAAERITKMIPRAFDVYENHLDLNDLNAARDALKMATIFVERKQVESSDAMRSDDDLWNELGGLLNVGTIGDIATIGTGQTKSDPNSQGPKTPAD